MNFQKKRNYVYEIKTDEKVKFFIVFCHTTFFSSKFYLSQKVRSKDQTLLTIDISVIMIFGLCLAEDILFEFV